MDKERSASAAGTIGEYIAALKNSDRYGPQVAHHREIPGQESRYGIVRQPWSVPVEELLADLGIGRLYAHQTTAIDFIRQGRDVIVATPTASGKSLIYNLPIFEAILDDPQLRALYLFPLKALAQDQLRGIRNMAGRILGRPPAAAICDGDTSAYMRRRIRRQPPNILLSNPEMLHLSLLGYHDSWAAFWQGVRYVVIDEVHTYRGVMGSHMAWVLKRLQRICRHYGREPQFILASATIGNPLQLARDLTGRDVEVIHESGAPRSGQHFMFVNPFDSAGYSASQLLLASLNRGLRTIVYTQSRKMTELISVWTKARLGDMQDKLASYRSGFLPEDRRHIEARLASGELLGVVTTSALELGIDIGELELCILVGYPGTIMATWQRGGRVGRREQDSCIIMIAQEDALDQHFMQHPEDFFERSVESAVLNPANTVIMGQHLVCAVAEKPLAGDDPLLAVDGVRALLAENSIESLLLSADGHTWYTNRKYPHRGVNLRGSGKPFVIRIAGGKDVLGEIDGLRCCRECHPGAVYLHQGRTWLVTQLDLDGHAVEVAPRQVDFFTRALGEKDTEILERYAVSVVEPRGTSYQVRVSFGRLRVTDQVTGYQKRLVRGQRLIHTESLDLPPHIFETEGLWIEIPQGLQAALEQSMHHFMGGIHAVEHAAISIFPLLVLCDRNDIGGISIPFHPQLQGAAIFIYDGYPGGIGLSRQAFEEIDRLLQLTRQAVADCRCESGCPSCVHSPKCGSGNRPIDKQAALQILAGLAGTGDDLSPGKIMRKTIGVPARRAARTGRAAVESLRYGVFDLETQRSAEEVGGWHKADKMGVSVGVLYDSHGDEFTVFRENDVDSLIRRLHDFDLVIGFNSIRFDYQVLAGYSPATTLHHLPSLDLLQEIRNQLGYRLSLDHLATTTLNTQKSGHGLLALQWYKEGNFEKLIHYCRQDVEITRDLFLFGLDREYLLFKNKAGKLVRCPCRFAEKVAAITAGRRKSL